MKKILIFGDSNTFGYIPTLRTRYDHKTRWSGILKTLLSANFEIIEEGCNNRTCFCDNPVGFAQTGFKILPTLLSSDLDVVILAVGINDTQAHYNVALEDFYTGLENLIKITKTGAPNAKIILAAPAQLTDGIFNDDYFSTLFDETSIEKSHHLSAIFEKVAEEQNCYLLDWNKFVTVCEKDGLHFEPEAHKIIAEKTFELLNKIF